MEPNTNEATAPKRLKTGGKKPIIIIGVIVAVLLAAYVGLCAYANSLDIFYPNTTINGVDVAGLTAEQAAGAAAAGDSGGNRRVLFTAGR